MRHDRRAPSRSPNPSGWRKEDETRARFYQLAQSAEIGAHDRAEIWHATRRALLAFKVNATQQKLLETLVFRTFECDWKAGSRPIVWLSNASLARAAGLSISPSSVRASLAALARMGFISYQDSGNCRRAGDRDEQGRIVYAYGIDLSVLEARYDELSAVADAHEAAVAEFAEARTLVQKLRRSIPAHLQSALFQQLAGRWGVYRRRYDRIVELLGRSSTAELALLKRVKRTLRLLLQQVQKAMIRGAYADNNDATASKSDCLLETTTHSQSVSCNDERNCADAQSVDSKTDAGFAGEIAFENDGGRVGYVESKLQPPENLVLHVDTVMQACPEMADWTTADVKTWPDLIAAAGDVRAALGISPDAWLEARTVMGPAAAAIAIAIIIQKHSAGLIRQPGGYLRGMTERYRAGELRLDRTIRGLLVETLRGETSKSAVAGAWRPTMHGRRDGASTPRLI